MNTTPTHPTIQTREQFALRVDAEIRSLQAMQHEINLALSDCAAYFSAEAHQVLVERMNCAYLEIRSVHLDTVCARQRMIEGE